jgi:hypothetical protein
MKNVLIYGGFNWLGYELTDIFIKGNMVTNIIIIDIMKHSLIKDNIRTKFDNYAHLYNENIFLYIIDIKDKESLLDIYNKHKIHIVINNIKYNIYDSTNERKNIKLGARNIKEIHEDLGISNYFYINRQYTHNKVLLNNQRRDIVEDNLYFNESISKISGDIGSEILIPDYIFGNKKDKHNNIVIKIDYILKSHSPLFAPDGTFFCILDDDLLIYILRTAFYKDVEELIDSRVIGPYTYHDIIEELKQNKLYKLKDCKLKEYILSLT